MTPQTVRIANAHDGVALDKRNADALALLIEYVITYPAPDRAELVDGREGLRVIANILRGKRRDGSEPGDAA